MTYLELVNEVLEELREDQVTSVAESDYSLLIGKFINDSKKKIEQAHDWSILRDTIRVLTTSGTHEYTLTDAGKDFRFLRRIDGTIDVYDDTNDVWLSKPPSAWLTSRFNDNNVESGIPLYFDVNGHDTAGDPYINLFPIPAGAYYVNFNLIIPQAKLSADADEILIPDEPVIRLAYMKAVRERGEDQGASFMEVKEDARIALADAIIDDRLKFPEQQMWMVV